MIAEIVGPSGRVHYRRSPDDPLVTGPMPDGYAVRIVEHETREYTCCNTPSCRKCQGRGWFAV